MKNKRKSTRNDFCTISLGYVHSRKGTFKQKYLKRARILLDTGCGGTLINKDLATKLKTKTCATATWSTKAGSFTTSNKVQCNFTLPEFHEGRDICWNMYVDESDSKLCNYDMIIGRDLLQVLGMDFSFSTKMMTWDGAQVPMKHLDCFLEENITKTEQ